MLRKLLSVVVRFKWVWPKIINCKPRPGYKSPVHLPPKQPPPDHQGLGTKYCDQIDPHPRLGLCAEVYDIQKGWPKVPGYPKSSCPDHRYTKRITTRSPCQCGHVHPQALQQPPPLAGTMLGPPKTTPIPNLKKPINLEWGPKKEWKTFKLNNEQPKASVTNTDAHPEVFKKMEYHPEKKNF